MAETLWTPWRMDYLMSPKNGECVFCTALSEGKQSYGDHFILYADELSLVIMNRFPYAHAHIMVLPRKHVSMLSDLTTEEHTSLFELVMQSQTLIWEALNPQGMNLGMNLGKAAGAGIEDHIHFHIVPRWIGDTNFMPVLADTRTMPQHLSQTYKYLLPYFEKLGR